jgi:diguanylate cyclase (GGDEF)-like protein
VVAQFQDVTARKRAEAELARLAVTDPLTGLRNRYALVECVQKLREAEPAAPVGIVFVDLDGFKQINDTHGHAAGDAVLVQAAQRLEQIVVAPNSAYRLGGDEFVVVVPDAEAAAHVAELSDRVRSVLTGSYETDTTPVTLTASVGSTWGATDDVEGLLRNADADMYRHKACRRASGIENDSD